MDGGNTTREFVEYQTSNLLLVLSLMGCLDGYFYYICKAVGCCWLEMFSFFLLFSFFFRSVLVDVYFRRTAAEGEFAQEIGQ